ncbi:MAG: regulatory iron-sulfur-containing complex subunit RicT [Flavipsychrobacter sp.]|nr:regulatory iron-sulfur-containing complex subunit RicT [Flavipsychrobacter sp.]
MGCGSCGTGASGKPGGCKSNGGCSTGGCNRLNVFDWLSGLPLHDGAKPYPVIEVSFNKGSRKDFYRNNTLHIPEKGEWITIEGVSGIDVGQVSLTGELVKLQMKKASVEESSAMKRMLRPATDEDLKAYNIQKEREQEILVRSRAIARSVNLDMKLCEVEMQADGKKGTFFYTADQRVDFRELIKVLATEFKLKVEMRQIGARQESGKVGGIGSCGRELCCSTWLTDFKSVNTTAARYQNLSINQTKLSGQCGRLKCCLNYELDTYMDALRVFPDHAETLQLAKGNAQLQKRDIFKSLMWYSFSDSSKQYPLSIVRVKEIMQLNKQGIRPDELLPVELETKESKAGIKPDAGFINDVGQTSLRNLEKGNKKKKSGNNPNSRPPQDAAGQSGAPRTREPREQREPRDQRPQREQRPAGAARPQGNQPQKQQQPKGPQQPRPNQPQKQQKAPNADGTPNQQPRPQKAEAAPGQQQRPPRPQNADGTPNQQPKQQRPPNPDGTPSQPRSDRGRNRRNRPEGGPKPAGEPAQSE